MNLTPFGMFFPIIPLTNTIRYLFRTQQTSLFIIIRFNTSLQYELYNYIKTHRAIDLSQNETKLYMNSAYTRFFNYYLLYAHIYLYMRVFQASILVTRFELNIF